MLVVSRKIGEFIDLYDPTDGNRLIASIVVADVRGDKARLGVDADRERVTIVRREVPLEPVPKAELEPVE